MSPRFDRWRGSVSPFAAGVIVGLGLAAWTPALAPSVATSARAPALDRDSFVRVVRQCERSVVFLHTVSGGSPRVRAPLGDLLADTLQGKALLPPVQQGLGSGVVIDAAGSILTNAHVVEGADAVHVRTAEGEDLDANIVGTDPETDLALLRLTEVSGLQAAPLGDSGRVSVGDWVVAVGNPLGLHHTATAGIVSAKGRRVDESGLEYLQTDAAVNRGSSGGPLFDLDGRVVGITTGILSEIGANVGLNLAIPVDTIKGVLPQLRTGAVVHGWLGIATVELSRRGARTLGVDSPPEGLLVTDIIENGPAARAWLRVGDVLLGIAGDPATPAREIYRQVRRSAPGTALRFRVWRGGSTMEIPVTVEPRPH